MFAPSACNSMRSYNICSIRCIVMRSIRSNVATKFGASFCTDAKQCLDRSLFTDVAQSCKYLYKRETLAINNRTCKSVGNVEWTFLSRDKCTYIYINNTIDSSLQLTWAICRRFCRWHSRQTATRNVRHTVQTTSCNFRRNVQSVDKRDVLVTLAPTPRVIGEHCLLPRVKQAARLEKRAGRA